MSEIEAKTQSLQPVKYPSQGSVLVITREIKSGDLEYIYLLGSLSQAVGLPNC